MIKHIWIEPQGTQSLDMKYGSADVLVETEDGLLWSAVFVTISYIQRQMEMNREEASNFENMPPVRFAALETQHVIVENLMPDTIEDTTDNLMTLGIFESVFVLHHEAEQAVTTLE